MAYVPPALRKSPSISQSTVPSRSRPPTYTITDIYEHFWPLQSGDDDRDLAIENCSSSCIVKATLNASYEDPLRLVYIQLFDGANPRWKSDRNIYVKTNLHLLPDVPDHNAPSAAHISPAEFNEEAMPRVNFDVSVSPATDPPNPKTVSATNHDDLISASFSDYPIAVFSQKPRKRKFTFIGYFRIAKIDLLEPESPELARMLDQKWLLHEDDVRSATASETSVLTHDPRCGEATVGNMIRSDNDGSNNSSNNSSSSNEKRKKRRPSAWDAGFARQWAVVKLCPDPEADVRLDAPKIKNVSAERSGRKKGVNEMLAELRMQ